MLFFSLHLRSTLTAHRPLETHQSSSSHSILHTRSRAENATLHTRIGYRHAIQVFLHHFQLFTLLSELLEHLYHPEAIFTNINLVDTSSIFTQDPSPASLSPQQDETLACLHKA